MTRRALTEKRKREIAEFNGWRTPQGEAVAIEEGELVTLHDGRKIEYDHIYQLALGGSDEIENMQPMSPVAHAEKTYKRDAQARGKVRRLKRKFLQPTDNEPEHRWRKRRWPKGRKFGILGLRKKLDGSVVKI